MPSIDDIKEWNRGTVADGDWLNNNTIVPIKENLSAVNERIDELNVDAVSSTSAMYESENVEKLAQVQAITGIIRIDESNPHKLILGF